MRDGLILLLLSINLFGIGAKVAAHTTSEIVIDGRLAQVPNPIIPRQPEQPSPQPPSPPPEIPLQLPPSFTPTPSISPDIPGTIIVKEFIFEGNTAFSDSQLAEVTKDFRDKPISFAQLLQAEALINKKYTDAGYINSGAVIPENQDLSPEAALVKIQIIEGSLEDIVVTGTGRLQPEYIRSRLAIATQRPLNQKKLLEALQLLQLNPLIQRISAELSAGARPELSLLKVTVQEADSFNIKAIINNGRVPSIGSFERGVQIQERNLLGFGDGLELTYRNTDGSNAVDIGYTIPFNPRNGTIKLGGGFSQTTVIEPPFDVLDITGDFNYYELSVRQPVLESPTQELALGLTLSLQRSQTRLLGENFPLSLGATDNGETNVTVLRFFQDWTQRNNRELFAVRSQFSLGIGALGATLNAEPPDGRFFSWRGQGQYVRLLAPNTLWVVRSDLQFASRATFPIEQFALGGLDSVRGYRQNFLLTDNAIFASTEVRLPVWRIPEVQGLLQVAPFIDFGTGWNSSNFVNPEPNTLVGAGFGLVWTMGDRLNARFDWGIPLVSVDVNRRTLNENGLYFTLDYNF
ncbi:ShlB/FhaC/HecB family hemolysin secretion/activation protein [Nostoc sp. FACHB-190]|uniref:ShlB/FhaC/HecB family hemolysin secretion/activation protein n=1 Tax=Nostoc sp. FACHB-190 TaxID=2692838 RepID=UPI001683D522|nr:ShlB/FhaC/HecB family hemolysin secretion/activation protein [Nostoc sp. FACHB-190]MBD2303550.1 ShlB/FhaC/HecB family hemolysin secretion/activation protein [Nostoc sp. FACHB-190]